MTVPLYFTQPSPATVAVTASESAVPSAERSTIETGVPAGAVVRPQNDTSYSPPDVSAMPVSNPAFSTPNVPAPALFRSSCRYVRLRSFMRAVSLTGFAEPVPPPRPTGVHAVMPVNPGLSTGRNSNDRLRTSSA